eukprot:m51a1_g11802 hypothetical protein (693) ;mRNA; f:333902-337500
MSTPVSYTWKDAIDELERKALSLRTICVQLGRRYSDAEAHAARACESFKMLPTQLSSEERTTNAMWHAMYDSCEAQKKAAVAHAEALKQCHMRLSALTGRVDHSLARLKAKGNTLEGELADCSTKITATRDQLSRALRERDAAAAAVESERAQKRRSRHAEEHKRLCVESEALREKLNVHVASARDMTTKFEADRFPELIHEIEELLKTRLVEMRDVFARVAEVEMEWALSVLEDSKMFAVGAKQIDVDADVEEMRVALSNVPTLSTRSARSSQFDLNPDCTLASSATHSPNGIRKSVFNLFSRNSVRNTSPPVVATTSSGPQLFAIVKKLCKHLEDLGAAQTEGIFRLSPEKSSLDAAVEAEAAIVREEDYLEVYNSLPDTNRSLLNYVLRFLQVLSHPDNVARTKMTLSNLVSCLVPCIMRAPPHLCGSSMEEAAVRNCREARFLDFSLRKRPRTPDAPPASSAPSVFGEEAAEPSAPPEPAPPQPALITSRAAPPMTQRASQHQHARPRSPSPKRQRSPSPERRGGSEDSLKKMELAYRMAAEHHTGAPQSPGRQEHEQSAKRPRLHHIGDFLPQEELARLTADGKADTGGRAAAGSRISADNKGHKMLEKMGWEEGKGLGASEAGATEPVAAAMQRAAVAAASHGGVGTERHDAVTPEDDIYEQYKKRMMLSYRHRPNPMNNPRKGYY